MIDPPRSRWQNYDYRAVTAGLIFTILGAIVFASLPSVSLSCSRREGQCTVLSKSLSTKESRSVALSSVERAKKECEKPKAQSACEWRIRLVAKGDSGDLFAGISSEQEAERYVQAVRDFLEGRGPDTLHLHRAPDRTMAWVLLGVGFSLVALGIRKNLADKGH